MRDILDARDIVVHDNYYSTVLLNDGTLWAWGGESSRPEQIILTDKREVSRPGARTEVTGELLKVTAISSRDGWSYDLVAITEDGGIWDFNQENKYIGAIPNTNIKAVAGKRFYNVNTDVSSRHYLALGDDGRVWAWGDNIYGQLGDGSLTGNDVPAQVAGLPEIKDIAIGDKYSLALASDGTVWTWGEYNGVKEANPIKIDALENVSAMSSYGGRSSAIQGSSVVYWDHDDGVIEEIPAEVLPFPVRNISLADTEKLALIRDDCGSVLEISLSSFEIKEVPLIGGTKCSAP